VSWDAGGKVAARQEAGVCPPSLVPHPCSKKTWEEELANAICSGTGSYSQSEVPPPYQRVSSEEI